MAFQDIRKSRRWLSAEEIRLLVLFLFVLVAFLAADLYGTRLLPGGEWLFLRLSGVHAFFVEKIEPYSNEIAQRTQQVAYGRPAFSSEYAYVLNDPFFIVLLYTPLLWLLNIVALIFPSIAPFPDFTILRAVWMLLSQVALVGIVFLAFDLTEWEPPRWLLVSLLVFGLFSYFSLDSLVTGSPAILLTLLYLCILIALRSSSDELAGALLSLVAYQWEVGGLFFLFIVVFVIVNHRWRVLSGLAMSLFILLVISFLIKSDWGLPYFRAVLSDWYRGENFTFGHILTAWFPNIRFPLGRLVSIALGIILLAEWLTSVQAHFRRVVWTASLSLAAAPLVGFPIFPSNHVALLLPFILIFALVWERWRRYQVLRTVFLLLLLVMVPFGLYYRSVQIYDPLVTDLQSILPPIAAVIGLYWMRWWASRSPRTWSDQLGNRR